MKYDPEKLQVVKVYRVRQGATLAKRADGMYLTGWDLKVGDDLRTTPRNFVSWSQFKTAKYYFEEIMG